MFLHKLVQPVSRTIFIDVNQMLLEITTPPAKMKLPCESEPPSLISSFSSRTLTCHNKDDTNHLEPGHLK